MSVPCPVYVVSSEVGLTGSKNSFAIFFKESEIC